ncbi:MAG: hypothetical protein Q4G22_10320 [Paracoccus sp. (in: a-proteobacteria)]|uniref:hypothetical protein n=1 Tax=Paracoccus sp. TaxID=267 RepID=UPI0026E0E648|nr:hypothetical protein [Paracoccus sp. (in: a-proteobacteria)]MDO5632219.1 hypothetical protein [Paracoccus sp. (in: a-proteobacteria)]
MNVTSAQAALTVLISASRGGVSAPPTSLQAQGTAIDKPAFTFSRIESGTESDSYSEFPWLESVTDPEYKKELVKSLRELKVVFKHRDEWVRALSRGEISPFDEMPDEARTGTPNGPSVSDPRFKPVGMLGFIMVDYTPRMGRQMAQKDAPYTDRRDAMAVAYHLGKKLSEYSRDVARNMPPPGDERYGPSGQLIGVSRGGIILPDFEASARASKAGNSELLATIRKMEMAGASLAGLFSFASANVTNAAYKGEAVEFSLGLTGFGKLIDFDSKGRMTLYDADGKAYSPTEYNEQDIGGGIPELYNDEIRREDARIRREENVIWKMFEQAQKDAAAAAAARGPLV